MAEIQTSSWSETAASNNASPPDGFPEGQSAASVNNSAREMMAAVKREWNRSHPTVIAGGTANALTLTYANAPPAYVSGMQFMFYAAGTANTATAVTINVNALGAKTVYMMDGTTPPAVGEIIANGLHGVIYDGTNFRLFAQQFVSKFAFPTTTGATGTITLPNGLIVKWGGGTTTNGVGSVTFAAAFPNACRRVMLTISGGVGATTLNPLIVGTKSTTGVAVYGDATQSLSFDWVAFGD